MRKLIFVISDLHLGGKPGFQICSGQGQQQLARFIHWASAQKASDRDVHLVLAGDIVDFLAEEPFTAFTEIDDDACKKLKQIFQHTASIWDALAEFVRSGGALTMLLGNHDVELSLPGPRRLLLERIGSLSVDFLYDNQAFVRGPVLVEHGNRYDSWNVVPHDLLRQVRSALSRGESPAALPQIPGSLMVVNIMNGIKNKYNFVDLLKPENSAAIPLLAVLEPSVIGELLSVAGLYRQTLRVRYRESGQPVDGGLISAPNAPGAMPAQGGGMWAAGLTGGGTHVPQVEKNLDALLQEAEELAGTRTPESMGQIGAFKTLGAFIDLWRAAASRDDKEKQITRLYRALRTFAGEQHLAFDVNCEVEYYLKPAREIARRGFKVVIFGHTHLAKRVALDGGAVYFNSGTWADIMRLPDSLLQDDVARAKEELTALADDILRNRLERWRQQIPSFVRVDMDGDEVSAADVFLFRSEDRIDRIPDGVLGGIVNE